MSIEAGLTICDQRAMWIRLLKVCVRRPLLSLFVAIALVLGLIATPLVLAHHADEPTAAENPRLLISRIWLDRYPQKSRDDVDLWLFFGSGFGVYEHGSRYRASMEFFEFERRGANVDITFFQDKKRASTRFAIKKCDDDKNFDLCLDMTSSPRGPNRYYSWGGSDEDSAHIPWASTWKRAAEERARAAATE